MVRRRRVVQPSPEDERVDEGVSRQDENPEVPENPGPRGRGRPRRVRRQRAEDVEQPEQEPPQGFMGIDQSALEAMARGLAQAFYQPRQMSDMEAIATFSRSFKVPFDGSGDPMDFLNAIRTRVSYVESDSLRIRMAETCLDREALDWYIAAIRPNVDTMSWDEFENRFQQHYMHLEY